MKMKVLAALGAAAAGTAIVGGVLAGGFPNITAPGYLAGQKTLDATCLNAATAQMNIDTVVNFDGASNSQRVTGATVSITDATPASIQCDGKVLTLTALDASGNALGAGTVPIVGNGANLTGLSVVIPGGAAAATHNGWAIRIA